MISEKMYKRRIRLWGLDKKHKKHEVLEILRLEAQRVAEGKRSTFVLRGRVVDMDDINRYLMRKKISFQDRDNPRIQGAIAYSAIDNRKSDLACWTPSPRPLAADPGSVLDETETFYLIFNRYLLSSIGTGAWTPSYESPRLSNSLSTCGTWVDILGIINLGAARFNDGSYQQAMQYWRIASAQLEIVTRSWNYFQLLNLISGIGQLADCDAVVAGVLLQHLCKLVAAIPRSENPQQQVLRSLSNLDPAIFKNLLLFTRRCCLPIFQTHFSNHQDFVLFWEAALAQSESRGGIWSHSPLLLARMVASMSSDQQNATILLSAAEWLIDALEMSRYYDEAEFLSGLRIERLQSLTQNDYVVGQLFGAWYVLARVQCCLGKRHEARQSFLLVVGAYEKLTR
jgi:hypothetical protein